MGIEDGGAQFLRLCLADTPDHFALIRVLCLFPFPVNCALSGVGGEW